MILLLSFFFFETTQQQKHIYMPKDSRATTKLTQINRFTIKNQVGLLLTNQITTPSSSISLTIDKNRSREEQVKKYINIYQ